MEPVKVAIVNDYEVIARGVAQMLRSYRARIRIVELDLNEQVEDPVDIALYDSFATNRPREDIRTLALNDRIGRVVVYSWDVDESHIRAALDAGATGYIAKRLPASRLVSALEVIHSGGAQVHTEQNGVSAVVIGDWPGREEGLSPREAEILALITQGLSNAEIANHTYLSPNSVKTYIRNCYRRINVTTRTNAVLWAIAHDFRPDRTRIRHPNAGSAEEVPQR